MTAFEWCLLAAAIISIPVGAWVGAWVGASLQCRRVKLSVTLTDGEISEKFEAEASTRDKAISLLQAAVSSAVRKDGDGA